MAHVPFPIDVVTDESRKTGQFTVFCEQEGSSDELRALMNELLSGRNDIVLRGDTRANVPSHPQEG